jgi:urea carboxylase-associated protein 2
VSIVAPGCLIIYQSIDNLDLLATPDLPPPSATGTTSGARSHARAQGGTVVAAMPTVPARSTTTPPSGVDPGQLTWIETVPGGGYATKELARGTHLRLTDTEGDACAHLVLYRADATYERLSVADTVKVLWSAYLGTGNLLLSDQGRVLASIVANSSGHHDTMAGVSTRAANEDRYGAGAASSSSPAGRELLILAAAKHGLGPRDIPASISFFKGVTVDPDGALGFRDASIAGASIELVAELPLIVLIANSAHPIDPRPTYSCTPLTISAWHGAPTGPDDPLWSHSPEAARAFLNTADLIDAMGRS